MELKHQLTPQLKHLRLSSILETLDVCTQQANEGKWSYIGFLARLLEDEVERRGQKQLALRLRRGALNATKTLETFDFAFNPALNRQHMLALAAGAGASCVISNPEKLTATIRAADLLLGRDMYAGRYIANYRKMVKLGLIADANSGKS